MDKDWSEKNKEIQRLLSKESTFGEAVNYKEGLKILEEHWSK